MPFGADHVEAAEFADLFPFGLHLFLLFDLLDERFPFLFGDFEAGRVFVLELGPRHRFGVPPEDDVGTAARHVRGDRDGPFASGLGDDLRLAAVLFGVKHFVSDAATLEQCREAFALLDANRTDQDRPPFEFDAGDLGRRDGGGVVREFFLDLDLGPIGIADEVSPDLGPILEAHDVPLVGPFDLVGQGVELVLFGQINLVRVLDPLHAAVGRDRDHVELVDLPELVRLGHRGAGHPGELGIELEEILQRDRREGLGLLLDRHPFLRLDRLVQAVAPLSPFHQSAGEFVDDNDLPILDDVSDIELVEVMRLERVVDQVGPIHVPRGVEALDAGEAFGFADPFIGQRDVVLLLVHREVDVAAKLAGDPIGVRVFAEVHVGRAADDQRRAGLIDQNVVDLVDDRVVQGPLALLEFGREAVIAPGGRPHVVTEVIEAELVVRTVGDVAGVGALFFERPHPALDRGDGQAEFGVERRHPFHVTACQIIVDRDDVHTLPFDRVEVGRECGDERLPFTGHHFGDHARMEDHAADQLGVVMPHREEASAAFATDREGVLEDVIERLAVADPLAEDLGL